MFSEITIIFLLGISSIICNSCFRAGVYEHIQINENNDISDGDIHYYLRKNLAVFKQVAEKAREEGVQVLVLPENGLFSASDRKEAAKLSENIPSVDSKNPLLPCNDKSSDKSPGILKFLSCLALENHLYLVADISDMQPCNEKDTRCPKDGHWIFNTAVAFDPKGVLVQKYHKRHLFGELNYDVPEDQEFVTFDTPWGSMGLMICFDIIYRNPGLSLIKEKNVTTLLLPTAWFDEFPFLMSSQYHNSWAMGNNVNLLAANMKGRSGRAIGSGIYSGKSGPLIYKHDVADNGLPSLMIANVPVDPSTGHCESHSKIVPLDYGKVDNGDYPVLQVPLSEYNYVNLTGDDFNEKVCDGSFCCTINGQLRNPTNFSLVFGLTNKVRISTTVTDYSWCEEACFFLAVDNSRKISLKSSAYFKKLSMKGTFTTGSVYPSVLSERVELLSTTEWSVESVNLTFELNIQTNKPISMAGLYGRCYDRDPPYHRSHIN